MVKPVPSVSRLALATLAGGLMAGPLAAQPADAPAPQRVEIEGKLASDTELRRRDPVAKSVYGREELDRNGDVSVSDVLKRLPGVTLSGGNPRLRGLGAGYTLILVNGEPAPPGFSLDNLSPSQVERIEVTKGPTAEHPAVAGTINVVLREAPRQRQRELRLNTGYQAVKPTASAHGTWGDREGALSYVLPLSVYQWRGRADNGNGRLSHDSSGAPQQVQVLGVDDWWGGGFHLSPRLGWKLGDADTLNLPLILQRSEWNNAGTFDTTVLQGTPPPSVHDAYRSGGRWQMLRASPQWLHRGGDGERLELKSQWQVSSSRSSNHSTGLDAAQVLAVVRDTTQHNLERQGNLGGKFTRPLGETHTLAIGWDLEARWRRELRSVVENGADQLPGQEGQPFETAVQRQAVYLQDEWEIAPRWSTYLGLRGETVRTRSAGVAGAPAQHSQAGVLAPVWHLNHKLDDRGRDLLRFSLNRAFKAPELSQLMGRYNLNTLYPRTETNNPIAPDRAGNPALRPELSTGLDLALEKYLPGGGLVSVGLFHRRISGLIRQRVALEAAPEADLPPGIARYVSRPVNLAGARSTGLELEVKGRADELLPAWLQPSPALNLRASFSAYRSAVDGLPGPDARLESQQPWSATLGFDHALGSGLVGVPLTVGASWAVTPAYSTQQSETQRQWQSGTRAVDAFVLLSFSRDLQLRLSASNLLPLDARSLTTAGEAAGRQASTDTWRQSLCSVNASLVMKF